MMRVNLNKLPATILKGYPIGPTHIGNVIGETEDAELLLLGLLLRRCRAGMNRGTSPHALHPLTSAHARYGWSTGNSAMLPHAC